MLRLHENKMLAAAVVLIAVMGSLLAGSKTASAQTQTEMNQAAGKAARSADMEMTANLKNSRLS